MSQPFGPQDEIPYPPLVYLPGGIPQWDQVQVGLGPFPLSGDPPIIPEKLPLQGQLTCFWGGLHCTRSFVQELIRRKTRLVEVHTEIAHFGAPEQEMIHRTAVRSSLGVGWKWNGINLGKYLAQGMTHMQDLDLIVEFSDQNVAAFAEIHPDPNFLANYRTTDIYLGALIRIRENRNVMRDQAEEEDRIKGRTPPKWQPPSEQEKANYALLAGKAAVDILSKKQGK